MGNLKVLFLSPEVVPYAKSGGLADVAGSLPRALKRLGVDVRLVMPYYRTVREGGFKNRLLIKGLEAPLGDKVLASDVLETSTQDGVPVYFLKREDLYDRPNLYGNDNGDYYDNLERFTFFSHSALRLAQRLPFVPDVIHCHDWQTGLVPALLKGPYGSSKDLSAPATVFTIHNMGYQGIFPSARLPVTGLSDRDFFHILGLEYWGNISLLKAGIVYSDAVTTVSPTYAQEIRTPEFGMGMEGLLKGRGKALSGILNGVDYDLWDPARDPYLPLPYSPEKMEGKGRCKESLIKEMGLDPSLNGRPLFGMISRLDRQKGLDILIEILDDILALDTGLVVLGSGDESIQESIIKAAQGHPGRVGLHTGFNDPLAHRIMAGADILLIPSRYEPCGLTQMYGLKYGTAPLVRATGGLNDTISPFDEKTLKGNGFKFGPYEAGACLKEVRRAVGLFGDQAKWKALIANGMREDFSWDRSAREYSDVYRSILEKT
jgi:starch synthase